MDPSHAPSRPSAVSATRSLSPRAARILGALLIACALGLAPPARASSDSVDAAIALYEEGDYPGAIRGLSEVLAAGLDDAAERARARKYLGCAWQAQGDSERARKVVEQILAEDRSATVDPALFPPKFVALFDSVRAALPAPKPPVEEPAKPAEPQPQVTTIIVPPPPQLVLTPPVPKQDAPSLALAFVPFGVGQFSNGSPRKGAFFLASEVLAYGAFAVTLTAFESKKLPGSPGVFQCTDTNPCRFEDGVQASRHQAAYLASIYTGIALTVLGIAEAIVENRSLASDP